MAEYLLNTGTSALQRIDYNGDSDSFQTALIRGLTYSFKVSGAQSGGGTLGDPNLALRSPSGTLLAFNDDITPGANRDAQITIKAGITGNHTLIVAETGNNASGSYTLIGSAGYATNANDSVTGTAYSDAINGMAGHDLINGGGGSDRLFGGTGNDTLLGAAGNDALAGDAGNDLLRGGDGNDRLTGAAGTDRLCGGRGADVFDFNWTGDSNGRSGIDVIQAGDGAIAFEGVGVRGGDVIDLSTIDANANLTGNQAFTWSLSKDAGTCHLVDSNGSTILYAHTNNDRVADLAIVIADGAITASEYSVDDFLL